MNDIDKERMRKTLCRPINPNKEKTGAIKRMLVIVNIEQLDTGRGK